MARYGSIVCPPVALESISAEGVLAGLTRSWPVSPFRADLWFDLQAICSNVQFTKHYATSSMIWARLGCKARGDQLHHRQGKGEFEVDWPPLCLQFAAAQLSGRSLGHQQFADKV